MSGDWNSSPQQKRLAMRVVVRGFSTTRSGGVTNTAKIIRLAVGRVLAAR